MSDQEVTKLGRNTISKPLLDARREYTVSLKLAGMSTASIQKHINNESDSKGWGTVTRRTVDRDLATYYRENSSLTIHDYDHFDQLRKVYLDQHERTIEKLSVFIAQKKDKMKPIEYIMAVERLEKMQMNHMELHNWNQGRQNVLAINIQQNNVNNVYDEASRDLDILENQNPQAIQALLDLVDQAIGVKEDRDTENVKAKQEAIEAQVV